MGTIVVGVDGSDGSHRALIWAVDEARRRATVLDAVYVYEHTPSWQLYAYGEGPLGGIGDAPLSASEDDVDASQRARELLDAAIAAVDTTGVEVHRCAIEDRRPAKVLVERSREADMLVIGSRGRGGFAGLLLGSVSQQCTQHAVCPVVVINTPGSNER